MLARLRDRLTYANVVATLALFVALGGSAYAVATIGSGDVKNRSLKGKDLRRGTVTGKEVKESSLGRVPRARSALQAANAQSAGIALTAANANVADLAKDSDAVGGLGASSLEKATRTQFGRALLSPPDTAGERVLLDWPELGARVTTAVGNGGCAGGNVGLRLLNTRSSGPGLRYYDQGSQQADLGALDGSIECSTDPGRWDGAAADDTGRTMFFNCQAVTTEVRCLAVRSEP
jgi:hypothetical protein